MVIRMLRGIALVVLVAIFLAIVFIRGAILGIGYACGFVGTILLFIGGRRSAAVTLRRWRGYWSEYLHLWWGDIARPFRRPRRVISLLPAS